MKKLSKVLALVLTVALLVSTTVLTGIFAASADGLNKTTLYDGDVTLTVTVKNYIGAVDNATINTAIRNDIKANGTITGDEYYEIITTGYMDGPSGYSVAGFVTGDYEFWGNDKAAGCATVGTSAGTTKQICAAGDTDKKGNLLAPYMNSSETKLAYFSDAEGSTTDTVYVTHVTVNVYRGQGGSTPTQPSQSQSTPSQSTPTQSTPTPTQSTPTPTQSVGGLNKIALYDGDITQTITIKNYIGAVNDATISSAIRNDLKANGTIEGDEYYEIITTGYMDGPSGYAVAGFVTGDFEFWGNDKAAGCATVGTSAGTTKQICAAGDTDKKGNLLAPDMNDQFSQLAYFSDAEGSTTDTVYVTHITINVYRAGGTAPSQSESTPSQSESTPSQSESTPSASESTPSASESTPSASESTPSASESVVDPTETGVIVDPTETGIDVAYGDANNDGAINMKDVLALRKLIAGMDVEINLAAADVNQDGSINMKDVLVIRKMLAGIPV